MDMVHVLGAWLRGTTLTSSARAPEARQHRALSVPATCLEPVRLPSTSYHVATKVSCKIVMVIALQLALCGNPELLPLLGNGNHEPARPSVKLTTRTDSCDPSVWTWHLRAFREHRFIRLSKLAKHRKTVLHFSYLVRNKFPASANGSFCREHSMSDIP